jgi:hypothetical protein
VAGLDGVTHVKNGRSAARAVKAICGVASGIEERKGESKDGVDWCSDLQRSHEQVFPVDTPCRGQFAYPSTIQPSSARRLACSHAVRPSSASYVPPEFCSLLGLAAVSQVLTAKLVLASS